jgi:hypothetical protein
MPMPLNAGISVHNKTNAVRSIVLLLVVVTLNSCSKNEKLSFAGAGAATGSGRAAGFAADRSALAALEAPQTYEAGVPETDRKLIKTARVQARVDSLKDSAALLETILEHYGGYASSSAIRDNSENYTLKIPGEHYDTALQEIGTLGKILYRRETVEDATIRFYDLDGRLNTRLELLKTFQTYLGKAANIDEIMTVERRIAELQQEIDWYGSQLADLSRLTDYATIDLELLGPASESSLYKPTLGERTAELFRAFAGVASTALLVVLGMIIYGIPALIILMLIFWVLFGRIGLIRRIWRLVGAKKQIT